MLLEGSLSKVLGQGTFVLSGTSELCTLDSKSPRAQWLVKRGLCVAIVFPMGLSIEVQPGIVTILGYPQTNFDAVANLFSDFPVILRL